MLELFSHFPLVSFPFYFLPRENFRLLISLPRTSHEQVRVPPNSLPGDIAIKIASSLQVPDVCSLGSCSRFWREMCGSDCLWSSLYRDRWLVDLGKESSGPKMQIHVLNPELESTSSSKGWRSLYIDKHKEMAKGAKEVVDFVNQCSSKEAIEVSHYLAAIERLNSMQFGFKDVKIFFFTPKLNVLLNLIGLHYCISWLGVSADEIMEALNSCKISERQVCVHWWKLGRWFYGFRLQDETHSRRFSLGNFALAKEEEVLQVLHRGAVHEVLRVQISVAKSLNIPWSCQSSERMFS
ncbi:hypothetical protein NMG60_11025159 [Bertholletia excelsa]